MTLHMGESYTNVESVTIRDIVLLHIVHETCHALDMLEIALPDEASQSHAPTSLTSYRAERSREDGLPRETHDASDRILGQPSVSRGV